jgi:hypothetical protein
VIITGFSFLPEFVSVPYFGSAAVIQVFGSELRLVMEANSLTTTKILFVCLICVQYMRSFNILKSHCSIFTKDQ